jgi:hypothetical protein
MLSANPYVDPSTYYNNNVVPKENCCDLSDNCQLYYDVRPVGRCYFRSPFGICKYFLNAGKHSSFYNLDIWFWNCSDSVVFFVFHFIWCSQTSCSIFICFPKTSNRLVDLELSVLICNDWFGYYNLLDHGRCFVILSIFFIHS